MDQIDQEREGEQIDKALLKNVVDIFVEIGMGEMNYYENDFEAHMLVETSAYYSRKASNWILEDSCPDYLLKANILIQLVVSLWCIAIINPGKFINFFLVTTQAEDCLKKELDRVSHYLHSSTEPKLLEVSLNYYHFLSYIFFLSKMANIGANFSFLLLGFHVMTVLTVSF